jgi:xylulokinase
LGYKNLDEAFGALDAEAESLADNPLVFVPHLRGERCPSWEPRVRGAWIGLSANHRRENLMRAAFEGVAFALKVVFAHIECLGIEQKLISVRQRATEDERWLSLRASVYERPLGMLNTAEPSALGAMILAAVGTGVYPNLREAVSRASRIERTVLPTGEGAEALRRRCALYLSAQSTLLPLWQKKGDGNAG